METPARTSGFRPYDVLSLLGLLVITGAFVWQRATTKALPGQPRWYYIAGLTLILAHLTLRWDDIAARIGRRQMRYGANTAVMVAAAAVVLGGLNYLAFKRDVSWDMSKGQRHSLSDQTRKVLAGLDQDLTLTYFERTVRMEAARPRLEQYRQASSRVKVAFVDPYVDPGQARAYEITAMPTLVVEKAGRRERISNDSEQDITNAIIKVTRGVKKTICFAAGEGERDPDDGAARGFSGAKAVLAKSQYETRKVVLAREGSVPADCTVVVVAGPEKDPFAPVVDALRRYVKGGGKVMLLLEPDLRGATPSLVALAGEWNITVGQDVVIDRSSQVVGAGPLTPVVMNYPVHEITRDLSGTMTVFDTTRSVKAAAGGTPGIAAQALAETFDAAWAETDLSLKGKVNYDEGKESRGPLALAAVATLSGAALAPSTPVSPAPMASPLSALEAPKIELGAVPSPSPSPPASPSASPSPDASPPPDESKREARVAVYGDSDWASNALLGAGGAGNQDLFANTVAWLAHDPDLISIRAREPEDQRLVLTQQELGNVRLFALGLLPGALLALGVYSWWRRRG